MKIYQPDNGGIVFMPGSSFGLPRRLLRGATMVKPGLALASRWIRPPSSALRRVYRDLCLGVWRLPARSRVQFAPQPEDDDRAGAGSGSLRWRQLHCSDNQLAQRALALLRGAACEPRGASARPNPNGLDGFDRRWRTHPARQRIADRFRDNDKIQRPEMR